MKHKHSYLFENKLYWIACIFTLLTMVPTDRDRIVWYCLAAVLCSTLLFSWMELGPKFISSFVKENAIQSILVFMFSLAHSIALARSFYLMWVPSNKLAALASHFRLNSRQLLNIIILFALPCMCLSLFVLLSYLLRQYQQNEKLVVEIGVLLFSALMAFQISQGISCGLISMPGLKHMVSGTLIIAVIIALIGTLTANIKVSVLMGTFPILLFTTVNYYVFCFCGREICPYDVFSIGTAMNVASEYKIFFSKYVFLGWLTWLFLLTALFLTKREVKQNKRKVRCYSTAICLLSLPLVFGLEKDTSVSSWYNSGSGVNGTVLNFILEIRDSRR